MEKCVLHMHAGIAIGGDVFPGSTLSDHCLRYENIPDIKLIVVLGELGGHDEYSLVDALKSGQIRKPVVAWVSGTCAKLFKSEVQFGHAGAKSGGASESAQVTSAPTDTLHPLGLISYCLADVQLSALTCAVLRCADMGEPLYMS